MGFHEGAGEALHQCSPFTIFVIFHLGFSDFIFMYDVFSSQASSAVIVSKLRLGVALTTGANLERRESQKEKRRENVYWTLLNDSDVA